MLSNTNPSFDLYANNAHGNLNPTSYFSTLENLSLPFVKDSTFHQILFEKEMAWCSLNCSVEEDSSY